MGKTEHDELQDRLGNEAVIMDKRREAATPSQPITDVQQAEFSKNADINWTQWAVGANDSYMACGSARPELPPGVYKIGLSPAGIYFNRVSVLTDNIIPFDDSVSEEVIGGIKTFWASQPKFEKLGILFKRGVLLWGPPGSGKTVTVTLLMQELVGRGGLVFLSGDPGLTSTALMQVRRIEPTRNLIVVLEDVEELVRHYGEHQLLALLDGENQIANVVHIATTNYPEQLGARIINRPSRFDEVRKIGMPNAKSRLIYLAHLLGVTQDSKQLVRWVEETDGMSVAHLRELVVATQCLGKTYEETIDRLKKMGTKPKSDNNDGFRGLERSGFASSSGKAAAYEYRVAIESPQQSGG